MQNRLIYINSKEVVSPASVGLPQAELVSFNTQDNETITGWFIAPKPNKPLILYFHGNAGRLQLYHKRFEILVSEGAGLLAITYRGYGASTGSPTEQGLYLDADAALAHALNLGFKPTQIVVIADSLGTGVATYLAQKHAFAGLGHIVN